MISIALDNRFTGCGKTYSLIEYSIDNFLLNKEITILVPNRSNIIDLFNDFIIHPKFLNNLYKINDKLMIESGNIIDKNHKIKLLINLFLKLNVINSFYNIDSIINYKKNNIHFPINLNKKFIDKKSDILIIDEIDRTLSSLSLKEKSNVLYYVHLPKIFKLENYLKFPKYYFQYEDWLESFILKKLKKMNLLDTYFNREIIKKLYQNIIITNYKQLKTKEITIHNFYYNYPVNNESELKFLINNKISYEIKEISLKEYCKLLNEKPQVNQLTLYKVLVEQKQYDDCKIYYENNSQIIFFENVYKIITNLVKPNGLIIGCSATKNDHVNDLINSCKLVSLPYTNNSYQKKIMFTLIYYKNNNYEFYDKSLIIKESKSAANYKFNNNNVKITYIQDPSLVGSNLYNDFKTFIIDFNFNQVKQAPLNSRLSFYSKIGNGFLKTENDIDKLLSTYDSFENEFKNQVKIKIIQAIGRMNRSNINNDKKFIWVKDIFIFNLIKKIINEKLKQPLKVVILENEDN